MRIAIFAHSFISDWNHGNAHFLRGIASELLARGVEVLLFEPHDAWSLKNLSECYGEGPVKAFREYFPHLKINRYSLDTFDFNKELEGTDLIIVHEWNDHDLVARLGRYRNSERNCRILFHDTHHRSVTDPQSMSVYDLSNYDGVLAFGDVVKRIYEKNSWVERAYVWHEAADARVFHPVASHSLSGDLVWIGNWGDDERSAELREYLFDPVKDLGIRCRVHGVRFPAAALGELQESGIKYGGWIPNYRVPVLFSRFRLTVHIPRRPYVEKLVGIPTIRPFEALACGIPLICSPWEDSEGLFTPGEDFLMAADGKEMTEHIRMVLNDEEFARQMAERGRNTVLRRHTCAHRVNELFDICRDLGIVSDRFRFDETVSSVNRNEHRNNC
ncbi:MAG: glycosyltransferase [Chitinispirillaceae bacterium]